MHHADSSPNPNSPGSSASASVVVVDPQPLSLIALAGVLHSQGYSCVCARSGDACLQALEMGHQDLIVWDVADDAALVLETLAHLRRMQGYQSLPAILLAESRWAGLEQKTESLSAATRCLFKPIDPHAMLAVAEQILWLPVLMDAHRRHGSSPSRSGWVTL